MGRHDPAARVHGDHERLPQSLDGPQPEGPVEHRGRPRDYPRRPRAPHGQQVLERPHAAPDLQGDTHGGGHARDEIQLDRPTLPRAVEVHDVYRPGAPALPLPRAPHGVRVVDLLAPEVPLLEADAPAAPQVYRRVDGETGGATRRSARQRPRAQRRKFS